MKAMQEKDTLRTGLYLLSLIRAALLDSPAVHRPDSVPWEQVWMLAKTHRVEAIAAHAIQKMDDRPPQEIWKLWQELPALEVYQESLYQLEWKKLSDALRRENLRYLPLKGEELSAMYPHPGMRHMADRDVLYARLDGSTDAKTFETLQTVMASLGYHLHEKGPVPDVFTKPPFFCFEMHKRIFGEWRHFGNGRVNPWEHAVSVDGYLWRFSLEHRFIYFMSHSCKHYENRGCGIRLLADTYVYLNYIRQHEFDWQAVWRAFRALDMEGFVEQIISLTEHCFGEDAWSPDPAEQTLLMTLLTSGIYGSNERLLQNLSTRHGGTASALRGRMILLRRKVFPPYTIMAYQYPLLERRRWLVPLCWIHRSLHLLARPRRVLDWFRKTT